MEVSTKPSKPIFKKWWFWLGIAFIAFVIYGANEGKKIQEAEQQAKTADSIAFLRAHDSLSAIKKAAFDALPQATRDSIQQAEAAEIKRKRMESDPLEFLSVKNWSWEKGGFGAVGIATITFANTGIKDAKDIRVRIDFKGESGTTVSSAEKIITLAVPAGKTKTASNVNFGFIDAQASNANLEILSADFTNPVPSKTK